MCVICVVVVVGVRYVAIVFRVCRCALFLLSLCLCCVFDVVVLFVFCFFVVAIGGCVCFFCDMSWLGFVFDVYVVCVCFCVICVYCWCMRVVYDISCCSYYEVAFGFPLVCCVYVCVGVWLCVFFRLHAYRVYDVVCACVGGFYCY